MMLTQTIEKLKQMKQHGFIAALEEQLSDTGYQQMSFEERLSYLVEREFTLRESRRINRLRVMAHFGVKACLEDVYYDAGRCLSRSMIQEYAQCNWIQRHQSLIITGATGAGKSFLSCALGEQACRQLYRVSYVQAPSLVRQLQVARVSGEYEALMRRLKSVDLLIVDEWLRDNLTTEQAQVVLELIEGRFRRASTLFASQLPVSEWHGVIQDPTLADAILDRVVHDAFRLELQGESMRRKTALVPQKEAATSLSSDENCLK